MTEDEKRSEAQRIAAGILINVDNDRVHESLDEDVSYEDACDVYTMVRDIGFNLEGN